MNDTLSTMILHVGDSEARQGRYAMRVAACLSAQCDLTTHDVGERLRFAREGALARARAQRAAAPSALVMVGAGGGAGMLSFGGGPQSPSGWWVKLASLLPLLALVGGLVLIQNQYGRAQVSAAAEIDLDLLVDELPPAAYQDAGFVEFLRAPGD